MPATGPVVGHNGGEAPVVVLSLDACVRPLARIAVLGASPCVRGNNSFIVHEADVATAVPADLDVIAARGRAPVVGGASELSPWSVGSVKNCSMGGMFFGSRLCARICSTR